jgi:branched-chain amino acid aminotransferase
MAQITVHRTTQPKPHPADTALAFGRAFTDHMFMLDYNPGAGWHDPRVVPYQPLSLDPATCVLHYAQSVFDGLKAFRGDDEVVRLFRPDAHAARLNRSCARLCIPQIDPALIEASLAAAVAADLDWVPRLPGTSLYLRPTVISTETFLGVRPSETYLYYVIMSPVGAYYAEGMNPVKILATDRYVRAVPGGLGAAKTAGNYAASLFAAEDAHAQGYTQVLWLDGVEHRYLDEVGTMNIMVRIGDEVITPPLNGSILAGITRDSVLTLLRDWDVPVSERPVAIDEIFAASHAGTLREMWGTGTAAVISPVGELGFRDERILINFGQTGELTHKLYQAIVAMQYGRGNDAHGWLRPVNQRKAQAA